MTKKKRLVFSVEIFHRYKRPENQKLATFASVTDSWDVYHELNEQMFLDFLYLIQQDQTNYESMDKFLREKSSELKENRAKKEADDVFKKYDSTVSIGNGLERSFIQKIE